MTTLYNLRHDGEQYRITKFVDDAVESSYLTTHDECDCPAGSQPTCRHRMMLTLPFFREIIDTHWFYDFDRGIVVDLMGTPKSTIDAMVATAVPAGLPAGVQAFGMDDLLGIHNAIADAVGEPAAKLGVAKWRRI
jgi:hypothetical protein